MFIDDIIANIFYIYLIPFLLVMNTFFPKGTSSIADVSWQYLFGLSMLSVYFVYLIVLPVFIVLIFYDKENTNASLVLRVLIAILAVPFFVPFLIMAANSHFLLNLCGKPL